MKVCKADESTIIDDDRIDLSRIRANHWHCMRTARLLNYVLNLFSMLFEKNKQRFEIKLENESQRFRQQVINDLDCLNVKILNVINALSNESSTSELGFLVTIKSIEIRLITQNYENSLKEIKSFEHKIGQLRKVSQNDVYISVLDQYKNYLFAALFLQYIFKYE